MNSPSIPPASVRLTSFSHGGGCGCKVAPGLLTEILRGVRNFPVPKELMVGIETADDGRQVDARTRRLMPVELRVRQDAER